MKRKLLIVFLICLLAGWVVSGRSSWFEATSSMAHAGSFQDARDFGRINADINARTEGFPGLADRGSSYRSTTVRDEDIRDALGLLNTLVTGDPRDLAFGYATAFLNRSGEQAITGLADTAIARLGFQWSKDGTLSGSGDVLLPLYQGPRTIVFTQLGLRSVSREDGTGGNARWVGNLGLGQRWYPFAMEGEPGEGRDGSLMLGYNLFLDADLFNAHKRASLGLEAQYDWISLSGNYYHPLSGWKTDGIARDHVLQEKVAQGMDFRLKGSLPFYPNVALTGSYSRWFGDEVRTFGKGIEKNPTIWSYGIEYTPIPLISAYIRQQGTARGDQGTDFGVQMTYRSDMSWDQLLSPGEAAKRGPSGMSRTAFVDRENEIVFQQRRVQTRGPVTLRLEKERVFHVGVPARQVAFRLSDPRNPETVSSQTLDLKWGDPNGLMPPVPTRQDTDGNGLFVLDLTPKTPGPLTLTATLPDGRRASTDLAIEAHSLALELEDPSQRFFVGALHDSVPLLVTDALAGTYGSDGKTQREENLTGVANTTFVVDWSHTDSFEQHPVEVRTDENGRAILDLQRGVSAQDVSLSLRTEKGRMTNPVTLTIEEKAPLTLTTPTVFYTGVSLDGIFILGGDDAANADVTLTWSRTDAFETQEKTVKTDGNSQFTLSALKGKTVGSVTVTAKLADSRSASATIEVQDGTFTLIRVSPWILYQYVGNNPGYQPVDVKFCLSPGYKEKTVKLGYTGGSYPIHIQGWDKGKFYNYPLDSTNCTTVSLTPGSGGLFDFVAENPVTGFRAKHKGCIEFRSDQPNFKCA